MLIAGLLIFAGCNEREAQDDDTDLRVDEFFADSNTDNEDEGDDESITASPDDIPPGYEIPRVGEIDRSNDFVVATINGIDIWAQDVRYEMLRVEMNLIREYFPPDMSDMDPFGGGFQVSIEDEDYDKEVRPGITFARLVREESARVAADLAIIVNYAHQIGVYLSEDDIDMVYAQIGMLLDQSGPEMFEMMLEQEGIRDLEHLVHILKTHALLDNLVFLLMSDPDEFVPFEEFMPSDYCDADERIAAIMEKVLAGEDFAALIVEYGEDPGMIAYPDGYTFVAGDMVPEFEEAVLAMEIGEISGIVRTDFGYHIIMRVDPDPDNIMTGSRYFWADENGELLGAKHILVLINERSEDDRKIEAILAGFEAKSYEADLIFLPALDDIPVGPVVSYEMVEED